MVGNMEDGATLRLPKIEATENELIKHVKGIIIDQLWNVDLLDLQTPSYSGLPLALEVWICPSWTSHSPLSSSSQSVIRLHSWRRRGKDPCNSWGCRTRPAAVAGSCTEPSCWTWDNQDPLSFLPPISLNRQAHQSGSSVQIFQFSCHQACPQDHPSSRCPPNLMVSWRLLVDLNADSVV